MISIDLSEWCMAIIWNSPIQVTQILQNATESLDLSTLVYEEIYGMHWTRCGHIHIYKGLQICDPDLNSNQYLLL